MWSTVRACFRLSGVCALLGRRALAKCSRATFRSLTCGARVACADDLLRTAGAARVRWRDFVMGLGLSERMPSFSAAQRGQRDVVRVVHQPARAALHEGPAAPLGATAATTPSPRTVLAQCPPEVLRNVGCSTAFRELLVDLLVQRPAAAPVDMVQLLRHRAAVMLQCVARSWLARWAVKRLRADAFRAARLSRLKDNVMQAWRLFTDARVTLRRRCRRKLLVWHRYASVRHRQRVRFRGLFWPFFVWQREAFKRRQAREKARFLRVVFRTYQALAHFRAWRRMAGAEGAKRKAVEALRHRVALRSAAACFGAWRWHCAHAQCLRERWAVHGVAMMGRARRRSARAILYALRYYAVILRHIRRTSPRLARSMLADPVLALDKRCAWLPAVPPPLSVLRAVLHGVGHAARFASPDTVVTAADAAPDTADTDSDPSHCFALAGSQTDAPDALVQELDASALRVAEGLAPWLYAEWRRSVLVHVAVLRRTCPCVLRALRCHAERQQKKRFAYVVGIGSMLRRFFRRLVLACSHRPALRSRLSPARLAEVEAWEARVRQREQWLRERRQGRGAGVLSSADGALSPDAEWERDRLLRRRAQQQAQAVQSALQQKQRAMHSNSEFRARNAARARDAHRALHEAAHVQVVRGRAAADAAQACMVSRTAALQHRRALEFVEAVQRVWEECAAEYTRQVMAACFAGLRRATFHRRAVHHYNRLQLRRWLRICARFNRFSNAMPRWWRLRTMWHTWSKWLLHMQTKLALESPGLALEVRRRFSLARRLSVALQHGTLDHHCAASPAVTAGAGAAAIVNGAACTAAGTCDPFCGPRGVWLRWVEYTQRRVARRRVLHLCALWRRHTLLREVFGAMRWGAASSSAALAAGGGMSHRAAPVALPQQVEGVGTAGEADEDFALSGGYAIFTPPSTPGRGGNGALDTYRTLLGRGTPEVRVVQGVLGAFPSPVASPRRPSWVSDALPERSATAMRARAAAMHSPAAARPCTFTQRRLRMDMARWVDGYLHPEARLFAVRVRRFVARRLARVRREARQQPVLRAMLQAHRLRTHERLQVEQRLLFTAFDELGLPQWEDVATELVPAAARLHDRPRHSSRASKRAEADREGAPFQDKGVAMGGTLHAVIVYCDGGVTGLQAELALCGTVVTAPLRGSGLGRPMRFELRPNETVAAVECRVAEFVLQRLRVTTSAGRVSPWLGDGDVAGADVSLHVPSNACMVGWAGRASRRCVHAVGLVCRRQLRQNVLVDCWPERHLPGGWTAARQEAAQQQLAAMLRMRACDVELALDRCQALSRRMRSAGSASPLRASNTRIVMGISRWLFAALVPGLPVVTSTGSGSGATESGATGGSHALPCVPPAADSTLGAQLAEARGRELVQRGRAMQQQGQALAARSQRELESIPGYAADGRHRIGVGMAGERERVRTLRQIRELEEAAEQALAMEREGVRLEMQGKSMMPRIPDEPRTRSVPARVLPSVPARSHQRVYHSKCFARLYRLSATMTLISSSGVASQVLPAGMSGDQRA